MILFYNIIFQPIPTHRNCDRLSDSLTDIVTSRDASKSKKDDTANEGQYYIELGQFHMYQTAEIQIILFLGLLMR